MIFFFSLPLIKVYLVFIASYTHVRVAKFFYWRVLEVCIPSIFPSLGRPIHGSYVVLTTSTDSSILFISFVLNTVYHSLTNAHDAYGISFKKKVFRRIPRQRGMSLVFFGEQIQKHNFRELWKIDCCHHLWIVRRNISFKTIMDQRRDEKQCKVTIVVAKEKKTIEKRSEVGEWKKHSR